MKKILILTTALMLSSTALAFGGGGSGRVHKWYEHGKGVDAIGVHIDDKEQVGIDICADDEEIVGDECLKKCGEGLERNTDNTCTVCTNGNVYLSYMPEFGTGACDTVTPMNEVTEETAFYCHCPIDGKCVSYEIYADISFNKKCAVADTPCVSNKDCASTEYCNLTSSNWDFGLNYCEQMDIGTCMPLGNGVTYTYNNKTFLRSDHWMTWLSAENWCRANGKKLISLTSVGIDRNNLGDYFNNNGYCYEDGAGTECKNVDWNAIGERFQGMYLGESYFWVRDNYNPCESFLVGTDYHVVGDASRLQDDVLALCE